MIEVKTRFEGFHCWKDAPDEVAFLRHPHRHEFHVSCCFVVDHNDRELEFFIMQKKISKAVEYIRSYSDTSSWSCEQWAETLLENLCAEQVSVHEDGENGAIVCR